MIDFKTVISKSSFVRGNRCGKSFWLHRKTPKIPKKVLAESEQFKLTNNQLVHFAQNWFSTSPYSCAQLGLDDDKDWNGSVSKTEVAIKNGHKVLMNPSFYVSDLMCDIHFLEKGAGKYWNAYIVKSSKKVSDRNLLKAAFQLKVIEDAGLPIQHFYFLVINTQYERKEHIEVKKLLKKRDLIKPIRAHLPHIHSTCTNLQKQLKKATPPTTSIGEYCVSPFDCEFKETCWDKVPSDSIFEIKRVPRETKFKWWNEGIHTRKQLIQSKYKAAIELTKEQNQTVIHKANLSSFYKQIQYPIVLLDFEGYLPALPPYPQLRPFEIIPFLYAAIKIEAPGNKAIPSHLICQPGLDPRRAFAESLLGLCKDVASIVVYDPLTEKQVIRSLINVFPDLKDELTLLKDKIIDLSAPIRNKDFYLPKMKGLSSMKSVLPAIDTELKYAQLDVQTGRSAANLYQILCDHKNVNPDSIEKELDNLVQYCQLDVLGLVKVYNAIAQQINQPLINL